jgi:hypothetical protein
MEEFGQAVILYLVNHAKLDKTRMSPTAKKLFFRTFTSLLHNSHQDHTIHQVRTVMSKTRGNHGP